MSYHGTIQPTLQRDEQIFVHGQGWNRVIEYKGGHNEILGILHDYINQGWETRITRNGAYTTLTATSQSPVDDPNDFYDRFTFTKEIIEKDIWSLDAIEQESIAFNAAYPGTNFDDYKNVVIDAIDEGDESRMSLYFGAYDVTAYPVAWGIYLDLLRGALGYEDEYLVLTRERIIGFRYGGELLSIPQGNASLIYTTSQFKSVFNIPFFVGIEWPIDPTVTPHNSKWGWRNRRREIRFQEGNRIELIQDWAYAAWSLFAYSEYTP